jgi:transcription elongation factor Elf1
MKIEKMKDRVMKCTRCGHESVQQTNHKDGTWSHGHLNTCPACPPFAKYPEFGGHTTWAYVRDVE